jgi:nicotinate-nucleotide pyrophosphorylase (carboxylating)
MPLDEQDALRVIRTALAEDVPAGDITSDAVIPEDTRFSGTLTAREPMVVAGIALARMTFAEVSAAIRFDARAADGDRIAEGAVLATVDGPARALLTAERTALNLMQHLSGIATLTRAYADAIQGTGCVLLDTRKTVPGLRRLAKFATACGGAQNHRMTLSDAILIKDNHIAVCGGVRAAVEKAKAADKGPVEVECDTLAQVREAVDAGAERILLDNMPPAILEEAVAIVGDKARTEASGGVTLKTIRAIAETGVDFVSVGRITQSAPAVDIGLDWTPTGG